MRSETCARTPNVSILAGYEVLGKLGAAGRGGHVHAEGTPATCPSLTVRPNQDAVPASLPAASDAIGRRRSAAGRPGRGSARRGRREGAGRPRLRPRSAAAAPRGAMRCPLAA